MSANGDAFFTGSILNRRKVINVNSSPFNIQLSSSNALFVVSSSAGALTLSLPPVVGCAGVEYTITTTDNTSHIISQSASDLVGNNKTLFGNIFSVTGSTAANGSGSLLNGNQKITLGGSIGDRIDVIGDGTNWHVQGTVRKYPTIV